MTRSNTQDHGGGEQSAAAGEKHQTDHDFSDAKRAKTERQTTLDESLGHGDTESHDDAPSEGEGSEPPNPARASGQGAVRPAEEPRVPSNVLEKGIF